MTEEIAAAPGWVDARLDEAFAALPAPVPRDVQDRYAKCLAAAKQPAAPSDLLGTEFERCRAALVGALASSGFDAAALNVLGQRLEALESELAAES